MPALNYLVPWIKGTHKAFYRAPCLVGSIRMALWQGKSKRKSTGGRRVLCAGKRKFEIGREKQFTKIGPQTSKAFRGMGGNLKIGVLTAEFANVIDKKTNTTKKVKIIEVKSNPTDPNYVQRNILNKGATISTEVGEAVVTSRPRQDGVVNAVLI